MPPTTAGLTPQRLLETAEFLIPTGPGRPAESRLRRSVSTSYLAVFSALSETAAQMFPIYVDGDCPTLLRLVDHGAARDVCQTLANSKPFPWLPGKQPCDPALVLFAKDFQDLQRLRHAADYNPSTMWRKRHAYETLERAERAVANLRSAYQNAHQQTSMTCIAVIVPPGTRKRLREEQDVRAMLSADINHSR